MKTGNYLGYCDRGYRRGKPGLNSDRLINGLVKCSSSYVPPPIVIEKWVNELEEVWEDESANVWTTG